MKTEKKLLNACIQGHINAFDDMFDPDNIDIDFQDDKGWSFLMRASEVKIPYIFEKLLESDIDLNLTNLRGETALIKAAQNGHVEFVEKLVNRGANVNQSTVGGLTAFDYAVDWNNIPMMYFLKPSIIDDKYGHGNTLLIKACVSIKENDILFLFEKGADFFIENDNGETAFTFFEQSNYISPKLQALKEKMILEKNISDDIDVSPSL